MNGLFLVKDEKIEVKGGAVIHSYKIAGDIDWGKEIQYIKIQSIIDRLMESMK